MDIIAALHWIQENIEYFGGDSKNVALVGHGTGAACIHYLIASAAVPEGLLLHFHYLISAEQENRRGIMIGGTANECLTFFIKK
jgi:acetyl esterase/lipase